MKQKFQVLFIITVLLSLLSLGLYVFIFKDQLQISDIEKRELSTTADLVEFSPLDTDYRDTIESILADQFFMRYDLISLKDKVQQRFTNLVYSVVDNPYLLKQVSDTGLYQIGDYPYFTAYPIDYSLSYENRILDRVQQINDLANDFPNVNVFVYKPTQLYETNILDLNNNIESFGPYYSNLLKDNLNVPYNNLKMNTLDDYLNLQYYSDHHWTHKGVYQGYLDIIRLIFNNTENVLIPWGSNCFDAIDLRFNGSYSTLSGFIEKGAPFCVYAYELPEYTLIYEGVVQDSHFDTNNYFFFGGQNPVAYHYGDAYDLVYEPMTLIELKTEAMNQENILVIGDSYGPSVLPLLAYHFNDIYFVNPINYFQVYDKAFIYDDFIIENNIQNVLIMYTLDNYIVSDQFGDRYKYFDVVRAD